MKTFLFIAAVLMFQPAFSNDDSTIARIQQLVDQYTQKGVPGLVLSVKSQAINRDFSAGYAHLESQEKMQPEHKLMVASVTKLFITVVVLRMAEDGKLDLDLPITQLRCGHLFKRINNANQITIRHLLNHTSGLPDFIKHPAFFLNVLDKPYCNWRQRDLLKFLKKQKPLFQPGQKAAYCNSNFLLLTMIIDNEFPNEPNHLERLSSEILQPLQMNSTVYTDVRTVPKFSAGGYAELYNDGNVINMSKFNTGGSGNGYSGIYSTAADLQKFVKALFVDKTLLSDSSMKNMFRFTEDAEEPGLSFGLGIWQDFEKYGLDNAGIGHRGRDIAYSSDVWWFPSKQLSVVLLANCGAVMDTDLGKAYKDFRKELFELLLDIKN